MLKALPVTTVARHALRQARVALAFHLPADQRVAYERRLRGRDEVRFVAAADAAIVSYGKSGRTWLRVMLSRFYQRRHGLRTRQLLAFDNYHRAAPAVPRIHFTHDNYLADYSGHRDSKDDYYGKRIILLVRDPADTAVSQYFQWKFRMRRSKKLLNDYPDHDSDIPVYDFVMRHSSGISKVIDFMNLWAREIPNVGEVLVVRYEDMRVGAADELARILGFLGTPGRPDEVADAVQYASIENMRRLESGRTFWLSGARMLPTDRANPDSYKVRRAKVGGYRDYFTDEQAAEVDAYVDARLDPLYGYARNS